MIDTAGHIIQSHICAYACHQENPEACDEFSTLINALYIALFMMQLNSVDVYYNWLQIY